MRGKPEQRLAMLSSLSTEDLIPADHPIRRIRRVVDEVLGELDGEFDAMYSRIGRPSVPPEQLLKATVLMALYSVTQRAGLLRALALRPPVQVVPRPAHRRQGLRPDDLHQEPGPAAGGTATSAQHRRYRRLIDAWRGPLVPHWPAAGRSTPFGERGLYADDVG